MSKKNKDGFSKILDIVGNESEKRNTPPLRLGVVKSLPPSLSILSNNITLTTEDLLVSEHLIENNRDIEFNTSSGGVPPIVTGIAKISTSLKIGDTVILYPVSNNSYVVLEKVMKL